jgi:CheY-like chemotaxis protein
MRSFFKQIESGLPALRCDPYKIKQILGNLASNALKFTPAQGSILFSIRRHDLNADYVVIECKDTGCGISKRQQKSLFRKIVNFDAQTSAALNHRKSHKATSCKAGSGLGLYITKGLVELHGGSIAVISEGHNKGSTFVVKLPFDHNYKAGFAPMASFCCDYLGLSRFYRMVFDPVIESYNLILRRVKAWYNLRSKGHHQRHHERTFRRIQGLSSEVSESYLDSSINESFHSGIIDNGDDLEQAMFDNNDYGAIGVVNNDYEENPVDYIEAPRKSAVSSRRTSNIIEVSATALGPGINDASGRSGGRRNSDSMTMEELESFSLRPSNKKPQLGGGVKLDKSNRVHPAAALTDDSSGHQVTSVYNSSNAGDEEDDLASNTKLTGSTDVQKALSSTYDSVDKVSSRTAVPQSARISVQPPPQPSKLTPIDTNSSGSSRIRQHHPLALKPNESVFSRRSHADYDNSFVSNKSGFSGVPSSGGTPTRLKLTISKSINPVSTAWLSGFHVLLVDDAMLNLKMVGMLMKRLGGSYSTATNGSEAVAMVTSKGVDAFDFVIMDNYMPVMDGPTAANLLRALGYSRPVIGLTGHALGEDLIAFKEAGANAVLTKPLEVAELKSILTLLMNTSH